MTAYPDYEEADRMRPSEPMLVPTAAPRRCALLLPVFLGAAAACSDAVGDSTGFASRDSAGIHIAENTAPLWDEGEGWRLASEPMVEIGMADGPPAYLLSRVGDVRRLVDGRILLTNGSSAELRVYDPDGSFAGSIGGEGDGPGEFRWPDWFRTIRGDSLLVHDRRLRRISIFSPQHRFVRSINLPSISGQALPNAVGAYADGSVLMRLELSRPEAVLSGTRRDSLLFFRISSRGEVVDTVAVTPGNERMMTDAGPFILSMPVLFGRSTSAVVAGDRLYLGSNDNYEIRSHGTDGEITSIVRRRVEPVPVTPEVLAQRQRSLVDGQDEALRRAYEQAFAEMPERATFPAYGSFLPDDSGNLWVEQVRPLPDDPNLWSVFDRDGRLLGPLELPRYFVPEHIGTDFVLGVATDDLGVERVRLYSLQK